MTSAAFIAGIFNCLKNFFRLEQIEKGVEKTCGKCGENNLT